MHTLLRVTGVLSGVEASVVLGLGFRGRTAPESVHEPPSSSPPDSTLRLPLDWKVKPVRVRNSAYGADAEHHVTMPTIGNHVVGIESDGSSAG